MLSQDLLIKNVRRWKWGDIVANPISGEADTDSSWVYVKEGRILKVGNTDGSHEAPPGLEGEGVELEGEGVRVIDGQGALLLPGLMDSHIHVAGLGESTHYVQLAGCQSIEDLKIRAQEHRMENSSLTWVVGTHWDQEQMGRYPTRFDLDKIEGCEGVPILLWRACWHIAVLNTKAMKLCGLLNEEGELSPHFRQPDGGVVDLMEEEGKKTATGIIRERAVEVAIAAMGSKSKDERKKFILDGLRTCLSCGLTGVQTNDEACYESYVEMASREGDDRLPMRVFLTPTIKEIDENEARPCQLIRFKGARHDVENVGARLTAERVKIFSDGSLGAETAAIRVEANTPVGFLTANTEEAASSSSSSSSDSYNGVLIHSTHSLVTQIRRARAMGWRVEVHAIGDASAEQVLTAMEAAYRADEEDITEWQPVLTHCQVLGSDLVDFMARNKVVANVQPSFVPTDMMWVSARLSEKHIEYAYCWKTLMQRGIVTAGGSDAPIESPNPFTGMHDAIYRESRTDSSKEREVFVPEQCLTFAEALYCYTINAAKCAGRAASTSFGQLEPGFAGDMVLVDAKVLTNHRLLHSLTPLMVVIGGHVEVDNRAAAEIVTEAPKLQGPFIPGKNGKMKRGWLQCDCCRIRI